MAGRAGAMIVETMIRLKPVADKTEVTIHFLASDQSLGFSESLGQLKVTKNRSADWGSRGVSSVPFGPSTLDLVDCAFVEPLVILSLTLETRVLW